MSRLFVLVRAVVLGFLVLGTGCLATLLVLILARPFGALGSVEIAIVWVLGTLGGYFLWRRVVTGPRRTGESK